MVEIIKYTLKVWLTTALFAPVMFLLVWLLIYTQNFSGGDFFGGIRIFLIMVIVELCFSFITAMLFCLAVTIIVQQNLDTYKQKQALFISAMVFGLLTFAIFLLLLGFSLNQLTDPVFCGIVAVNMTALAFSSIIYTIPKTEY